MYIYWRLIYAAASSCNLLSCMVPGRGIAPRSLGLQPSACPCSACLGWEHTAECVHLRRFESLRGRAEYISGRLA